MVVQHNMPAMTANRYYTNNNSALSKSMEKLSSGLAINRAGDNAAGLAVSEKMRAQIAGLTQASKNAQDGISMVQTFEGALQETDSILQRMRTLAVQSANGSYQDDVDRDAMQIEFDQLNDELNQIADTDFNGVVVLNGGQMADGLKSVNGKFDYSNFTRESKQLSEDDVNLVDQQLVNDTDTTNGKTKSDTVWATLFGSDRTNTSKTDDGPDSFEVTLKYDANASTNNKKWTVESATNGAKIDTTSMAIAGTENGGFSITSGGVKWANVVVDESSVVDGDTITLTYKNPAAVTSAPTNAGATLTDSNLTKGSDTNALDPTAANLSVTIGSSLTSATMTEDINNKLNALNGSEIVVTYTADNSVITGAAGKSSVSIAGTAVTSGTTGGDIVIGDEKVFAKYSSDTVEIYDKDGGTLLMTLTPAKSTASTNGTTGTAKYTIGFENNAYDDSKKPSVSVKTPTGGSVSTSNAYSQSNANMTYATGMKLQVGARTKDMVDFKFSYSSEGGIGELKANMNCSSREDGLGTASLSISDQQSANDAIDKIDNAINKVSMVRATFGAIQNRLEHKISNIDTNAENITAAESRIRDTQMDQEMMKFTSAQILSQASQSMLAQANSLPQGVLQLLG